MITRPLRAVAFCLALIVFALPQQASAVSIEVIVNGVPITSYDISQRVALMRVSGQSASTSAATEQLIDEAIQVGEAARRGVRVTEGQVEAAYATIAGQVGLSVSQFTQALNQAGVESETLKQQIRAQIYWSILMQARLQIEPIVNQQDVTAQLLAQGGESQMVNEYLMQKVIFVAPSGSSNSYISQRRSEAEAFRQRFTSCENTLAQSINLRDVTVQEIGRDMTQLTNTQAQAVRAMSSPGMTRPEQTSNGIEVIAVCSVRAVQANEQARTELQNELLIDLGDEIGQDYLAELREQAIIIRQ